nr:bifunctional allantoicase/(S)-ureidoglycine aminohydrolase [uncultured Cohaesibacter sp.]
MSSQKYHIPKGGLPPQTQLLTDKAIFTSSYAVLPKGTMRDIVCSQLPFWSGMRMWVLARPLTGFAESFSQYIVELLPGGGSDRPETDVGAESALFVVGGEINLVVNGVEHSLDEGGFGYIPAGADWSIRNARGRNAGDQKAVFHWFRKAYVEVKGLDAPEPFFVNEKMLDPIAMPETEGKWATTRFMDPEDMRHDMHITVVTFEPGAVIPFMETHVMEHGLYVLEGKAVYKLNQDWVEVEAGDFMWLRAFCPQACYAGGPGKFRYLLYKDVNRHMSFL